MTNNKDPKIKNYSWNDIDKYVNRLKDMIIADRFIPDIIVGIIRGGCIPSVYLSHLLEVRSYQTLNIQSTTSEEVRADRKILMIDEQTDYSTFNEKNLLIVDDVTNTGDTIKTAHDYLKQFRPKDIKIAVLVWDTVSEVDNQDFSSTIANYYATKIDAWAVFPWEKIALNSSGQL